MLTTYVDARIIWRRTIFLFNYHGQLEAECKLHRFPGKML